MKITRVVAMQKADSEFRAASLADIERRKQDVRDAEKSLQKWDDETFPVERKTKGTPHAEDEKRQFVGEFVVFTSPYGGEYRD